MVADSTEVNPKAYPLSTDEMTNTIINFVNQASNFKMVKTGVNESIKALNRGHASLIVIAADVDPIEIVLPLPMLCEDKNCPYVFVRSQLALGRAAGVNRAVAAIAILAREGSELTPTVNAIVHGIEKLLV